MNNNLENFFKRQKCIVTGGAGLIGSYISELLFKLGADVTVIDDLSKGDLSNISFIKNQINFINYDLENYNFYKDVDIECDYFFHLASRAYGIAYSKNNNNKILNHNEKITNNILTFLGNRSLKGALFTSSSCVYPDDGPDQMNEQDSFIGEPEMANYGYGWAKRILEKKVEIFGAEVGYPIAIPRPFNIYGERYKWQGENSQAIPMIVKRVMESEASIEIWGSGEQRRNYIHASDCAKIMIELVFRKFNGIVNLGTEATISLNELTNKIIKLAEMNLKVKNDLSKPEGRFIKSANSERLKKVLGHDVDLSIKLDEGLRLMIEWYRRNVINHTF